MFLFPPDLPIKLMPIQGNMLGDDSPAILIRPAYGCSFCHAVSAPGPGGAPPQPAWCWWNPSAGVCLQTQLSQSSCFTKLSYIASFQWMPAPWASHIPPVWITLLRLVPGHQWKQGDNEVMLSHTARIFSQQASPTSFSVIWGLPTSSTKSKPHLKVPFNLHSIFNQFEKQQWGTNVYKAKKSIS